MRKFTALLLIAALTGLVFLYSCNNEEDPKPAPTISVAPESIQGREGNQLQIAVSWTAAAEIESVASSSSNATTPATATGTSGTFTSTITVGSANEQITYTITDKENKTATATVTVTVSDNPQPSIGVKIGGSDITNGATAPVTTADKVVLAFTLSAADGLKELTAAVNKGDAGTLEKNFQAGNTSGSATYTYEAAGMGLSGQSVTHTFILSDSEDDEVTFTVTTDISTGTITIKDADLEGNTTYNWYSDVIYMCDGLIYLEADGVLNIEAGTIIKFVESPTSGDPTSAFIVARGAKIMAEGTADAPIIFTAETDDLTVGLAPDQNTKWGGLVLLGYAPAEKDGQNQIQIEGIPTSEPRGLYGGQIKEDDSGVLKYVSIRYTGFALNGQSGDEIQGLTLGGVGSGTTIDYVEVFSSSDDGVEIFGGTVDIKHFAVAFASDDSYDFDQGWTGQGQFIFALQGDGLVSDYDYAGEWDGFAVPTDIFSAPNMVNCTLVGPGKDVANPLRDRAILMREGFAGKLVNSIIVDFPGFGIQITNLETDNSSCNRINNPFTDDRGTFQVELLNNTWSAIKNYDGADMASMIHGDCSDDIKAELVDNDNNAVMDNVLVNTSGRNSGSAIDPRPSGNGVSTFDVSGWGLESVSYRGAFAPDQDLWLKGWSTLSKYGYLVQ